MQRSPATPAGSVQLLLQKVIELVQTRIELLSLELEEGRDRALAWLARAFAALVLLSLAAGFVGLWFVIIFWDTHRIAAVSAVTATFLFSGLAMLYSVVRRTGNTSSLIPQTIAELRKDSEALAAGSRRVGGDNDE